MNELSLVAQSPDDLLRQLKSIDIKAPKITQGRTHLHREKFVMAHFLATIAKSRLLHYPLTVEHSDKPDFILHFNSEAIGVECVEAVPEEWYEIEATRERKYSKSITFGQYYDPHKKLYTAQEKDYIASGACAATPWMGHSAEIEWADAIAHFIHQKTKKLRAGNYSEMSKVWLLIQDEWRVPVHGKDDLESAIEFCLPLIPECLIEPCFNKIFICSCNHLVSIDKKGKTFEPLYTFNSKF